MAPPSQTYDFAAVEAFFQGNQPHLFEPIAREMNTKHPVFAQMMQAIEASGVNGFVVDELMLGILIVWRATVQKTGLKLGSTSEATVHENGQRFIAFLQYHKSETDVAERKALRFLTYEPLELFAAQRLKSAYGQLDAVPAPVSAAYLGMLKCFDDAIAKRQIIRTRRKKRKP